MNPPNSLTPDSASKAFFRNPVAFASFCNAVLFDGRQIIKPEKVEFHETDLSTIIVKDEPVDTKRYRDVLRKVEINGVFAIIGIENQSTIDPKMLVRCGNYDWLSYINELESKKAHEKLTQRVTVVFYTGPDKWNAEKRLKEMINKIPELEKYFNDWNYIIVDVKEIDTSKIRDEQTYYFIKAIQAMYKGSYEDLKGLKNISKENFLYAAVITGSIDQVKDVLEGDEMDMCEGMERMAEEFRKEGRSEGIIQGRTEGIIEGKLKEKQNTLLTLLTCKLGNISKETENTIRSSTMEKLNKLTVSIFDIQSEEDALRIIN